MTTTFWRSGEIGNLWQASALGVGMHMISSKVDLCSSQVPYFMPCTAPSWVLF